jgi:hypothetical protein
MEAKGNFKVQKIKRFVKDEDSGLYHGKVKIDSIEYDISDMNQWDYDTLKKDSDQLVLRTTTAGTIK